MQFERLDATFGRLEHTALSFSGGLNIIEAPNESGKSTLLAFLRAMLYGLPTRERGALADKNRYAPWSLAPMRGTLSLSCALGEITLQRDTARANSPMGRFSAVYTDSSDAVPMLTASDCGEILLGVPCEVYERSAFIRQNSLAVSADAELERRIAALITTGEEGASYTEAAAALKKQLNARKYNKSGRIPALEAEIDSLERMQRELQELSARRSAAEDTLASLDSEERTILDQLCAHDLCDAQDAHRAVAEAKQRWQDAEAEADRLRRALRDGGTPPRETLVQARANLSALDPLRAEAAAAARRQTDAEAALDAFDAASPKKAFPLLPYIITAALAFIVFLFIRVLPAPAVLAGRLFSGAALLALVLASGHLSRKAHRARTDERAALEQTLRDAQSSAAAQQRLCANAEQELLSLLPISDLPQAGAYLRAALARWDTLDAQLLHAQTARIRYETLAAQTGAVSAPAKTVERPALSRAALKDALSALQISRREAQSVCDHTDGRCRAIGDAAELEAALAQKRAALARQQTEYDAITLAMNALQSANTALQSRFSPALSRRTAELFSRLTGGKYDRVLLDRSFSALTQEHGESVSHNAQLLSLGTLDQLYLAVRLAICETVLPESDPPPIVLDDALVRFDDARCRAALDLLLEESKTRQILLFTCQHRESAYLAGRGGVALLTLT